MKINDRILREIYEKAAIEQTAEDLINKGYSVEQQAKIGEHQADLVAKQDDRLIVFEFKSAHWNYEKMESVAELKKYVTRELSGEFKLVLVNLPSAKEINVESIEEILYKILEDNDQVNNIATHVSLEEVADIDISSVDINEDQIHIKGNGIACYELQYGSDSDVDNDFGMRYTDCFPFDFSIFLNHDMDVDEVEEIDIDTSSFYE